MKKYILFVHLIFLGHILPAQTPLTDPHWKLVWSDEFDTDTGNKSEQVQALRNKWHFVEGWGNTRFQTDFDSISQKKTFGYADLYADDSDVNVEINHGIATLITRKDSGYHLFPCKYCWGKDYPEYGPFYMQFPYVNSPLISNKQFRYGYFETRIHLPSYHDHCQGKGINVNIWMFPESDPWKIDDTLYQYQELDIFETQTPDTMYQLYNMVTSLHIGYPNNSSTQADQWGNGIFNYTNFKITDWDSNTYHKIGFEWTEDYFSIYVDDICIRSLTFRSDKCVPMNLYFGTGLLPPEGDWGGPIDPVTTEFPFRYDIDYARVYTLYDTATYADSGYVQIITDSEGFNFKQNQVKKSITVMSKITNPDGSVQPLPVPRPPAGSNAVFNLRARREIILDEGFECDENTPFFGQVTDIRKPYNEK